MKNALLLLALWSQPEIAAQPEPPPVVDLCPPEGEALPPDAAEYCKALRHPEPLDANARDRLVLGDWFVIVLLGALTFVLALRIL